MTSTTLPQIKAVDADVRRIWAELLGLVQAAPARARIAHALFQCGGSAGLESAKIAVTSYIDAAEHWDCPHDKDEYFRAAARIARIIGDGDTARQAIERLLDGAEQALTREPSDSPGYVLRPLDYAIREPNCPERADALLSRAATELRDADDRDRALVLIFDRCTDDHCRNRTWRRRIDNLLTTAESETGIVQMSLRHNALKIAEASGIRELKERAAAALQATRHADLEMVRVGTSVAVYAEIFDQTVQEMAAGDTWQEALLSFARCGPLSGNYESNCTTVEHIRTASPLLAAFPGKILGPDGLPLYEATTPEDRFDGDLTKVEAQLISVNLRPLTAALHSISERFGIPDEALLVEFFTRWPSTNNDTVRTAAVALQRFWCGDYEGAAYIATPWIENAIRHIILDANQGIYMLQRIRKPGQYPGLGAMIDLLPQRFTLSQSRYRFLKATLTHPLGLNLRNQLSHGMQPYNTSAAAALVLHTLLSIGLITARAQPQDGDPGREPE